MALSAAELSRLQKLEKELNILMREETEAGVKSAFKLYSTLLRQLRPYIQGLATANDEAALAELMQRILKASQNGLKMAESDIHAVLQNLIRNAAVRGMQAPEVLALAVVTPGANLKSLLRTVELLKQARTAPLTMLNVEFQSGSERVARTVEQRVYQDGLNLSSRLHRRTLMQQADFEKTITEGIQRAKSAAQLGRKLEEVGGIDVKLPQYLQRIVDAHRKGDTAAFNKWLNKALGAAEKAGIADSRKTGPLGVRDFTKQFLKRMQRATSDQVDEYISDYLTRKARYHATVVARHETNEAYRQATVEAAAKKPWVLGLQFTLSHSHPAEDICDDLAAADMGMGPGVYPVGQYPRTPHPNCMCHAVEFMDSEYWNKENRGHLLRELNQGREGAA